MPRKIVFRQHRAWGDELMLTSGIRDFKTLFPDIQINVKTNYPWMYENNPHITPTLKKGQVGVEYYHVGYPTIQNCNAKVNHFTSSFLYDMIAQANAHKPLDIDLTGFCMSFSNGRVGDGEPKLWEGKDAKSPFKDWRERFKRNSPQFLMKKGELFLTQEEKDNNIIKKEFGIDRYWVIAPGGKSDCTTKIWDWRKFQKVVDHYKDYIKFVSIGTKSHILQKLDGVIDLTDKLSPREICSLIYNSEGTVSGVSFLMHATACIPRDIGRGQFPRPCVAIYGGREPQSFTSYEGHQVLHTGISLTCCDNGGCWESHVVQKGENKRVCKHAINSDGKKVPKCMDMISSEDVIRAIEKYYEGNTYNIRPLKVESPEKHVQISSNGKKEINILGSLSTKGGGEQSLIHISNLLRENGWKVNLYPWDKVHNKYKGVKMEKHSFKNGMLENMKPNLPLLFYANDQIYDFCKEEVSGGIVGKSSSVVVGINYVNADLPKSSWLFPKLRAVIFQNQEKLQDYKNSCMAPDNHELISLFGAINLDKFIQIYPVERKGNELVVLKHCTPDPRKYVTESSVNKGEKIHPWQKTVYKETDVKFYKRLLKDIDDVRFEFMEAHPELVKAFPNNPRMVFHKWDSMKVEDFLRRGHVYLYRTSNLWRDQYPRCVAEALAVGIPVLSEPRDGTKDRIVHGTTGLYCIDYDAFIYSLRILKRKENFRAQMGKAAKTWARDNLNPKEWVNTLNRILL